MALLTPTTDTVLLMTG